jgi:LytS/YehU family sensor histidine kinase
VENSAAPESKEKKPGSKGIGIDNTRHRLELLYPGKHHLQIQREPDRFRVELELKL